MSSFDITEIELKDKLNINFGTNSKLILSKNKINFIFGNNGAGKTQISNFLTKEHGSTFFKLEFDNTFINDNKDIVTFKNANLIIKIENEINEIVNLIINNINKIIGNFDLSSGSPFWKNHLKPYLSENDNLKPLINLVKAKGKQKELKLNFDEILSIYESLKKCNFDEDIIFKKYDLYTFNNVKEAKNKIIEHLNKINNDVKTLVINEFSNENINIEILENIYENISNLVTMKNCYICENEIKDFEKIKNNMKLRISNFTKKYLPIYSIKEYLKIFNDLFKINLNCFNIEDIRLFINEIKNYFLAYEENLKYFIKKIKIDAFNEKVIKLINLQNKVNELKKERKLKKLQKDHFNLFKEIIEKIIGKNRIEFEINPKNNYDDDCIIIKDLSNYKNNEVILPFSDGEKRIIQIILNIIWFISSNDKCEELFLILDDPNDSLDYLNTINFLFSIKYFFMIIK